MYVIQRKLNEVIKIGDNIEIKLLRIGDSTVHIGIEAPKEISIRREEEINKDERNK